jgi:hypothetical protein
VLDSIAICQLWLRQGWYSGKPEQKQNDKLLYHTLTLWTKNSRKKMNVGLLSKVFINECFVAYVIRHNPVFALIVPLRLILGIMSEALDRFRGIFIELKSAFYETYLH